MSLEFCMARELDAKDIELIKKLVPKIVNFLESGRMEIEYMNILPPVAITIHGTRVTLRNVCKSSPRKMSNI